MKNKMFRIVGVFSYGGAVIALLIAITMGGIGLSKLFTGTDSEIASARLSAEDYVHQKQAGSQDDATTQKAPEKPGQAQSDEDQAFQSKLQPLFSAIVDNMNSYAAKTGQQTVNRKGFEQYLIDSTKQTTRDEYLAFLHDLKQATASLVARAPEVKKLNHQDPAYIKWDQFLQWYVKAWMDHFKAEKKRVASENMQAVAERSVGMSLLISAGVAFAVFVSLIVLLLLVQVEINTRKASDPV